MPAFAAAACKALQRERFALRPPHAEASAAFSVGEIDAQLFKSRSGGVALGSDFDGCKLPAEIGDVTGLPRLVDAMRRAGYGERLITRICRDNWIDALDRAGMADRPDT